MINVQKAFEAGDIGLYPLSEAVQVEEQKGELLQKFLRESRYGGYVEHIVHEAEVPKINDADEKIGSHTALSTKYTCSVVLKISSEISNISLTIFISDSDS